MSAKIFAWDGYRTWVKVLWVSILIAAVLAIIGSCWPNRWGDYPAGFAALVAIVSSTALQHYKCPRCRKSFFYDGMWFPWRKNCARCGLPKWEGADYVNPNSEQIVYRNLSIKEMASDQTIPALERSVKFLTLVLRDDPGAIHLPLDSNGWADVQNLLTRANRYGFNLTRETLGDILVVSENHRFEWDQKGDRIRWAKD